MKYKVTYEYRGKATVEVDAETEKEAENKGQEEADEMIVSNLSVFDVTFKEAA